MGDDRSPRRSRWALRAQRLAEGVDAGIKARENWDTEKVERAGKIGSTSFDLSIDFAFLCSLWYLRHSALIIWDFTIRVD
jgi:hypothetical protein